MIPFNQMAKDRKEIEFRADDLIDVSSSSEFPYLCLNVGNPVCAVFVDDFDFHWRTVGKAIENHTCFPERTNVVFVRPVDESNIEIRIWNGRR